MRISRRGVIAQNGDPAFIWKIYTVVMGINENEFTEGSFEATKSAFGSAPTKMAADSFTVSSSGTISLTNAVSTSVANLTGKYIVSVTSSSNTSTTSTKYLYKVLGVTSSGSSFSTTYTIAYQRFTVGNNAKGTFTGELVEADELIYPLDGIWDGDGRWYELIYGEYEAFVWEQYDLAEGSYYVQTTSTRDSLGTAEHETLYNVGGSGDSTTYRRCANMSFDKTTGKYTLSNQSEATATISGSGMSPKVTLSPTGGYYGSAGSNKSSVLKIGSAEASSGTDGYNIFINGTRYRSEKEKIAGDLLGTVESVADDTYPQDAISGIYWYKYSHSYIKSVDNR